MLCSLSSDIVSAGARAGAQCNARTVAFCVCFILRLRLVQGLIILLGDFPFAGIVHPRCRADLDDGFCLICSSANANANV